MEQIEKYVDIYNNIIFTYEYIYIDISIYVIDIYLMSQKKPKYNL